MPGAGEKRLLKKKKHKQKRKQEQERKRLSAPNPVRGILFSREKSASGDALRSSLVASGDVNQQPVTPALSKARVTTVESERQELPSSTESDLLVSRTASSNASATRNDKDAQSPETRRSGLEGQYDNQKRQAVQMRGADFPLRTRVNDKVEKERRGGVKVRPAEVPSTGFLGIKLPVKDHEISSELFLPAQSFLHTNNVRTRKSRGISPKKLRLSGSKVRIIEF